MGCSGLITLVLSVVNQDGWSLFHWDLAITLFNICNGLLGTHIQVLRVAHVLYIIIYTVSSPGHICSFFHVASLSRVMQHKDFCNSRGPFPKIWFCELEVVSQHWSCLWPFCLIPIELQSLKKLLYNITCYLIFEVEETEIVSLWSVPEWFRHSLQCDIWHWVALFFRVL